MAAALAITAPAAQAAEPKRDGKSTKAAEEGGSKSSLPSSGLIAGSKTGEYGGTQIDGPWGGIKTSGGKADPISGSCSKSGTFSWSLRVFNNTEDRYNGSLQMLQFDTRNRQLKSDSFFAAIPAGQKVERVYQAHPDSAQCAVKLNNWKLIPRKKSQAELQQEIDQKKKELSELEGEVPASDQGKAPVGGE